MAATLDQVFGVLGAIQTSMEQAVIPNTDKCAGALTNMVEVFAGIKSEIAESKKGFKNGLEKLGSTLSKATTSVPVVDNSGVINELKLISSKLTTIIKYMIGTSVVGNTIKKKLGNKSDGNSVLDVIKALKDITIKDIVSAKMKLKMLDGVIDRIVELNKKLADSKKNGVNTKNIKEFISTITLLSDGMLKFTASMALVTVLAPIAALGVLASWVMIKMSHWLFDAMGDPRDYKNIIQGAEALKIMGTSLLMFTASMALSAIITSAVFGRGLASFEDALATVGVFALAFVTYAIFTAISAGKEPALAGAKTLALMSLGLLMFVGTFYLTTLMVKSIFNSDSIGENIAAMFTTVLIFGLALGTLVLFNMIAAGAPTSMVGAASLMFMSIGLLMFAGVFYLTTMMVRSMLGDKGFDDPNNLAAMGGTVAIFGLAIGLLALFGLAASLAPASILGSISLITMSLGLLLFGFTFKTVSEMLPEEEERNSLAKFLSLSIIGLTGEFTLAGLAIVPIGLGAAAVAMMGGSLIALGKGLGEFQKLAEDKIDLKELFIEYDKSPDKKGLIPTVLTGARDAFASLVSAKSIKQNLKAKAGQLVVAGMGQVLSKLAIGVGAFGLMTTKGVPILDKDGNITGWSGPIDFPMVADNLAKVLTAVTDAVTSVLDKNGADTVEIDVPGFLGMGKKRMKVPKAQAAIQSLMGLGELVQGLSKGIETFGKLDQKKLPTIKDNMKATIMAIGEAFTEVIGDGETVEIEVPGLFGIGKKKMTVPKAQAGIQALMGLGEILGGITNAVDAFKDLDEKKVNNIKTNMITFCNGFVEAFSVDFKNIDSDSIEDGLVKPALAGKKAIDALSGISQYDVYDMGDKLYYGVRSIISSFTVPVRRQRNVERLMNRFVLFAKYAKGFESISRSMDNAKNILNSVDIEKVQVVTDLYSAMGDLMRADNSKFNKLMERVEETFETLVEALNNNTKATEENSVASQTETDSQEAIVKGAEKEQKVKETKPQQPAQQSGPQSIDVNIRINGEDISDGSTLIISKQ